VPWTVRKGGIKKEFRSQNSESRRMINEMHFLENRVRRMNEGDARVMRKMLLVLLLLGKRLK
jgi:hypothetical protein